MSSELKNTKIFRSIKEIKDYFLPNSSKEQRIEKITSPETVGAYLAETALRQIKSHSHTQ